MRPMMAPATDNAPRTWLPGQERRFARLRDSSLSASSARSPATDGKPYILKVVCKSPALRSTTSFSAFDKPSDVRPPAEAARVGHRRHRSLSLAQWALSVVPDWPLAPPGWQRGKAVKPSEAEGLVRRFITP
ncbi:hypothetical protein GCM10009544_47610 [Streptomyces stramineus]|uniref:Uncharacterized protein n=1 Tax=Streptomyces stramineus TaxID=173861 RepID=A0ABN1AMJ1_9ACTN